MFGVSKPDLEFFSKYPVTHAAEVDQPDLQFYENYPEVVENSARVTTYFIRNLPITIFRVAEAGGNPQAGEYELSSFEHMRARCEGLDRDSVLLFLPGWIADSADYYSGWRWLGDVYYRHGTLDSALNCYQRAVDDMAGDFSLWALIGDLSWEIFRGGASGEYRQQAIAAWTRAMELSPNNPQLAQRLSRAYGR
jgi:tetratricopeptide (TPR) repeat protein